MCGCEDKGLTTGPSCAQGTPLCPNPEPCAETFSDCCIIHNGDTIVSGPNDPVQLFPIIQGERVCDIFQKMVLWLNDPDNVIGACPSIIGIKSMSVTSTTIQVGWNLSSSATGYTVGYSTDPGVAPWVDSSLLPATASSYTITGLTAATTYYIRVLPSCVVPTTSTPIIIQVSTKSV